MEENGANAVGWVIAFGVAICSVAIGVAIAAFMLAGLWKMFVKAGQPGWAALVPFYNVYVLVQIVGLPVVWFYYYVILIAVGTVLSFLAFFTSVGLLVLSYYIVRMIHRAYGQNDDSVSVIISLFVPIVLTYRAGFGSAQYLGPQSMHDMPNLPWIDSMPARPTAPPPPPPPTGSYIPTLSSNQPNETPLVDAQPVNVPPVSGGPTDPGVDMGSLPQMGNNKDQQQQ
jgi:hypothetical protein